MAHFFTILVYVYRQRQNKCLASLVLLKVNGLGFIGRVPFVADIYNRVPGAKIPLIKEPGKVFSAGFFQCKAQLVGLAIFKGVCFKINTQTFIKSFAT